MVRLHFLMYSIFLTFDVIAFIMAPKITIRAKQGWVVIINIVETYAAWGPRIIAGLDDDLIN